MNKYLLLSILPLLSIVMIACDDDEDVQPMDLNLFAATWEVVDQGNQKIFGREDILGITSAQIHESYGAYQGYITTYALTVDAALRHDRVFSWCISEVENHQPLLDVVFQGELDSDDPWAGNYPYKIIKLTDTYMWWQVNTNGENSIIKFIRRTDLRIE